MDEKISEIKRIFGINKKVLKERIIVNDINFKMTGITYITGYSGCGKTTLVKKILLQNNKFITPTEPNNKNIPIIELFQDNLEETIRILSLFGLSEPFNYLTTYNQLSIGQQFRLQLALLFNKNPKNIIIDEFLSTVDRETAKFIAYNFQKICRKNEITAIVVTCHNDLIEAIAPDTLIELDFSGEHKITELNEVPTLDGINELKVEVGTIEDYRRLERFHYFGMFDENMLEEFEGEIYTVRYKGMVIGVTVFMLHYPKSFNEIKFFRDVNEKVISLYRTIIHPAFRGISLSKKLTDINLVKKTVIETRSALGLYIPFFKANGYSKYDLPSNILNEKHKKLTKVIKNYGYELCDLVNDYDECIEFINKLSEKEREDIDHLAKQILIEATISNYCSLRMIGDLDQLTEIEFEDFSSLIEEIVSESDLEDILHECLYFKMQGFYKVKN